MLPQEAYSWAPPDLLDSVAPEEALLDAAAVEFYRQRMAFFYSECVKLNADIHIMTKIRSFPLDVFTNHAENIFWSRVLDSLYEASLIRFTKLADDTSHDLYNLLPFKTWVVKHTKKQYRQALCKRLAQCKFEQTTAAVRKKARALRRSVVAHLRKDFVLGLAHVQIISLAEFRFLRDSINRLLDTLSFNAKHMMLPFQYAPDIEHRDGFKSDIDELLDFVALHSQRLNEPETNPVLWSALLEALTNERPEELALITKYRRKFGKPTPWDNRITGTH